jgi:hypothetical protein
MKMNSNSKNYTLAVKTNRYVYHVSYRCSRESIKKNGLIGGSSEIIKYSNAIFAHNNPIPNYRWFPFCFDEVYNWNFDVKFNDSFDDFAYQVEKNNFDFWQIDTQKINNKWFLDDIGMGDFYEASRFPFLVVTFGIIPPQALKRFRFHEEPKLTYSNGVAHVQGRFRAVEN